MTDEPRGPLPGEHLGEDQLLDLALSLLEPAEDEACMAHLRACPACEEQARLVVGRHSRFLARMESVAGRVGPAESADPLGAVLPRSVGRRLGLRFRGLWAVPLVAVAAVALVLVLRARTPGNSPGGEARWLIDPAELVTGRGPAGLTGDVDLREGLRAYSRHDLDEAIRSLARSSVRGDADLLRRVYWGSALALKPRPREAVSVLRPIPSAEIPAAWRDETRWTLFIALRQAGESSSSDSLLRVLASEPGEVGDRARGALRR